MSPSIRPRKPFVLWFTGLSGAGKTTIATVVSERLREQGHVVEYLDGDVVRAVTGQSGFSREDRERHIRHMGFLASRLEKHGVTVVAAFVSPYAASRDYARGLCATFIEIYVSTPLAECERRDVKGLYARARRGEVTNFTGVSDPYEAPTKAELVIDTAKMSVDEAVAVILKFVG